MKSLAEWIKIVDAEIGREDDTKGHPHTGLVVDNLVAAWGGISYAELSVVVVHLRYLSLVHQTHHWTAKGDPFFGDHKLFEELYDTVSKEIDVVAEKSVGLGGEANVNLPLQISQVMKLCSAYGSPQTVPQSNDLARASLVAEFNFLKILKAACDSMKSNCTETPGVENMLQQLFDTHERHVYLLKRRCSQAVLGF